MIRSFFYLCLFILCYPFYVLSEEINLKNCNILTSEYQLKEGKLSDFWAQEIIGADLLKEELKQAAPLPENKYLISVFDSNNGALTIDHDVRVKNLITDSGPHSVLPQLTETQVTLLQINLPGFLQDTNEQEKSLLETAIKLRASYLPSFINFSMGIKEKKGINQKVYQAFSSLSPHSIVIISSGNGYFTDPIFGENSLSSRGNTVSFTARKMSQDLNVILAGSLSPQGVVSYFSSEDREVHILAPSDNFITSANKKGDYKKFSGTSGAAPLVTGSLGGFEWLSGYHPTAEEAKLLLKQTAIPTIHSQYENSRRNGFGLLNSYKLGKVALRLKEKCDKDTECFATELQEEANYQFPMNDNLWKEANQAFPKCAVNKTIKENQNISCAIKKQSFQNLRKAALLNPSSRNLWKTLSCIYHSNGFTENALGLNRLGSFEPHQLDVIFNELLNIYPTMAARLAGNVGGKKGVRVLYELLSDNPHPLIAAHVTYAAGIMNGEGGKTIWQKIKDSHFINSIDIRKTAVNAFSEQIGKITENILIQLSEDEMPEIKKTVAENLINFRGKFGESLLWKLSEDKNESVKEAVVWSAWSLDNKEARKKILIELSEDDSDQVKKTVAESAGYFGGELGKLLLWNLSEDENESVKKAVVWSVWSLDNKEVKRNLLIELSKDDSNQVRKTVAKAAGYFGGELGKSLLWNLSEDETQKRAEVRRTIAENLINFRGEFGESLLWKFLGDEDESVKRAVVWSAWSLNNKEITGKILTNLSEDESVIVKEAVISSITQILIGLMAMDSESSNPMIEEQFSQSILEKLTKDEDPQVKKQATTAVEFLF